MEASCEGGFFYFYGWYGMAPFEHGYTEFCNKQMVTDNLLIYNKLNL